MIAGLDSASEPSAAQARKAAAAGIRLWSGYIATRAGVGLYHPWPRSAFENARLCGSTPIAYASGWDDPAACKRLAAAWNVRLCLDIEGGIRGDGSWAQAWLDQSGAGVYGNAPVHRLRAPFHVLAAYPGIDPKATWSPRLVHPSTPCGWQFQGTHSEFGIGVDRGWFDDWFAGKATYGPSVGGGSGLHMDADVQAAFDKIYDELRGDGAHSKLDTIYTELRGNGQFSKLDELLVAVKAQVAGGGLSQQQVTDALTEALKGLTLKAQ